MNLVHAAIHVAGIISLGMCLVVGGVIGGMMLEGALIWARNVRRAERERRAKR